MRLDEKLRVIYETIAPTITRSEEAWKAYLRFAASIYKHHFDNALLVYAQNPKATMLATIDVWNSPKVGRFINKGEKSVEVCEYMNERLTIKHLFDISQTNGKAIPVVWKLDEGLRKGLTDRLTSSRGLPAQNLNDCIRRIVSNTVAGKVDAYLRGFEADIQGHFLGSLPQDGLTAEIEELIGQSCGYLIACRCGIEADEIKMPTISHFDTVPLIARLGYAVTEISKGILLEIERSVKLLNSERSIENEQRTLGEQRTARPPRQLGNRERGAAPRQIRQNGDGTPVQHRPPKVFTFEDAGKAYEPDVSSGRGSGGTGRDDNAKPPREEPAARDGEHLGENTPPQPIKANSGGNRNPRDSADTAITEPPKEPQGSFSLPKTRQEQNLKEITNTLIHSDSDESAIKEALLEGTDIEGGKKRINEFARGNPTAEALTRFIKDEYGTGGRICGGRLLRVSFNSDGMTIGVRDETGDNGARVITLTWNNAAKRIAALVDSGEYVKDGTPSWREYEALLYKYPDSVVFKRLGDFYEMMGLDAKKTADELGFTTATRNVGLTHRVPLLGIPAHIINDVAKQLFQRDIHVVLVDGDQEIEYGSDVAEDEATDEKHDAGIDDYAIPDEPESYGTSGGKPIEQLSFYSWGIHATSAPDSELREPDYKKQQSQELSEDNESEYDENGEYDESDEPDVSGGTVSLSDETPRARNYRYSPEDNLYPTGAKAKYHNNIRAIRLLKALEAEKRAATPDEQRTLAGYVGWGGIANAFNEDDVTWKNEYQELKLLLTDEEYSRARSSILTAYYTEQELVECVYKGLDNLGFNSGAGRRILDPAMGTGNFFSVLPESLKEAKLYGVELDSITGRIAKLLYPDAHISVTGYENTDFEDNSFDVAIGNIPFNSVKVYDRRYEAEDFYIHNYFIAKTIDKVKPGGIIAFITSKGTMDRQNDSVRKYIARRAELLGAVRLPNTAFKSLAGTQVTTDVVFLQKRREQLVENALMPYWTGVENRLSDYIPLNTYFIHNPEMLLGKMQWDRSMYGNERETACIAAEGQDLREELSKAMGYLHGAFDAAPDDEYGQDNGYTAEFMDAPKGAKNFTYLVQDDKIFFVERMKLVPMNFTGMAEKRVKGLCGIKAALLDVIAVQSRDYEPLELTMAQNALNKAYDAYVAKYGVINSAANTRAFRDDDQLPLLCSIEKFNKKTGAYEKEDIFTKATIRSYTRPISADSVLDALMLSINYYQKVNLRYIAGLCDMELDEAISELGGKIYLNPLHYYGNKYEGWEIDEEYLSGNVRHKLEYATVKALDYPELFTRNVEALKAVQPEPLKAGDISFRIGTKWIPLEYYQKFMHETFGTADKGYVTLEYNKFTSTWFINNKLNESSNARVNQTFGTKRMNAYEIYEETLNLQNVVVRDAVEETNADGKTVKRYVTNPQETAIAREKQEQIREKFSTWLFKDSKRAEILVGIYNDRYNVYQPRTYDGSYLNISGMNEEYMLMKHQLDFVARAAHTGSALNGHVVGGGKTLSLIAAGMYMKGIGAIKKPVYVVPNNIIGQWANDFYRFFPAANILITTEKDFTKKNRQKFISKIAVGEYDAVLITQSQFEKIPVSLERQMDMMNKQIDEINWAIKQAKKKAGGDWSIKDMERMAANLEVRLEKLAANWKKDEIIDFESLGIDFMFVDEAHAYKNGFIFSKIRGVAGVGRTSSQRAMDMLQKCQYLQEINHGRGVIFATGTPISNSLSELYVIQRYLQPDVLRELDSINFDDWVSNFAEVSTALEITPEGNGYRLKTRFSKFFNLPELMNAFMLVADIKTADMLDLETPELEGGKAEIVVSELNTFQKRIMSILSGRATKVRNKEVKPHEDNMLAITNDARIMSADARMLIPSAPGYPNSKIAQCADDIYNVWKSTGDKRLTQIAFSDIGTPKKNQFNVYSELRRQCIIRGVPAEAIEFIHNAHSDDERRRFFERMNCGELRLMLGSTQKLGTGTNVQKRLYTVHHIDCPWRPSDIEQRDGRILRQGNDNPAVRIRRYVARGSFDSFLWQVQEQKLKFINQVITGRAITRDCEDLDETVLTAAQIKAMANGNPAVAEKMEIDNEVTTLRLLKSNWQSEQATYKNNIEVNYPKKIASYQKRIQLSNEDISEWERNRGGDFRIELEGRIYDERTRAADVFEAIVAVRGKGLQSAESVKVGSYRGFELYLTREWYDLRLELHGKLRYAKDLGEAKLGNITRIENTFEDIPKSLKRYEEKLADTKRQLEVALSEAGKPFEHEERLSRLVSRQTQLNTELEFRELKQDTGKKNYQAAHVGENFDKLEAFAPEILHNGREYMRFRAEGYSDLYFQRIGADILKIAYYYDAGNYRMRDPEVLLKLDMAAKTVTPVSYVQDTMQLKQDVNDENGILNGKLLSDLDEFIYDWLTDIETQGYSLSPERRDEAEKPFFDEKNLSMDMLVESEDEESEEMETD